MIRRLITAVQKMRLQRLDPEAVGPAVHSMDATGLLLGRGDETMLKRMRATARGRQLLDERHDILTILKDRDALREMPEGSLGRLYCRFAEDNQLFPEQLAHEVRVARSESGGFVPNATPEVAYLHDRYRDLHDLWHVVTGYGTDMAGELSIVGFQTKQVGYRAMTILATVQVFLIVCRTGRFDILKTWLGGRRRGKTASYLLAADWERLLPMPLDEVRRELDVEPVGPYRIWNYPTPSQAAAEA